MKKLIFVFLLACALALCLSACTVNSEQETIPAEGHDDQNNDGICDICTTKFASIGLAYTLSDNGTYYSVSGIGKCKDIDIFIPFMHNGLPVKEIAYRAFHNCDSLTNVVIPDSVTSIGEEAFSWCDSLTGVVIPDSVTSIGGYAFYGCSRLTSVVIGDSVTSIEERAFGECSRLTSVVIPDSVTSIGGWAFYNCDSLTSVVIPDSVTSIGHRAFYDCAGLENIYYRGTASQWEAISKESDWNFSTGSYTMTYNYTGK